MICHAARLRLKGSERWMMGPWCRQRPMAGHAVCLDEAMVLRGEINPSYASGRDWLALAAEALLEVDCKECLRAITEERLLGAPVEARA